LESALPHLLGGLRVRDWAERTVFELLRRAGQSSPPARFSDELLRARKVTRVTYDTAAPPIWGRLLIRNDGFEISLSPVHGDREPWRRFALAHEISHTLLYDITTWPPRALTHYEAGNRDLEWLCGYVAKCLLVPGPWLLQISKAYPQAGFPGFSFAVLSQLERDFRVPWPLVAERLVEHLGLWDCVVLRFAASDRSPASLHGGATCEWRLNWHTVPDELRDVLFIPVGRREPTGMRFPRTRGILTRFIESSIAGHSNDSYFQTTVRPVTFNVSTTGNLGKFLAKSFRAGEVPVYGFVHRPAEGSLFDRPETNSPALYVALCIPLAGRPNVTT